MADSKASPPRMMHMYKDGITTFKILDSDKKTVLYRTRHQLSMTASYNVPKVEVFRTNPTAPTDSSKDIHIGTAYRRLSNKKDKTIDLELGDHKVEFRIGRPQHVASLVTRVYQSPRSKGRQVTWEAFGTMKIAMTMSEDNLSGNGQTVLAKLERVICSWKKLARITLYNNGSQELMDEIAVASSAMWLTVGDVL